MPRMLAAIPSPFGSGGELDLDAFAAHLEWLLERGLHGVFVGGTTGEGVLLEADELVALVERAVAVAGDTRVIAQVGRPSTRAAAALLERAYDAGAAQAAAYVPWFYPATDEQVRAHFLALLAAARGRPFLAYTIPSRHVNVLRPAVLTDLVAAGLAGMKDSTGDPECHRRFVAAAAGRPFRIYTGSDELVLGAIRSGGYGAITALAGARPDLLAALGRALGEGDDEAAERASAALAAERDAVKREGPTVAAIKRRVRAALAERGVDYPASPRAPFN
jgi:dihydrodipicolinate synthase/N-acetylneuraminate lyase